MTRAAELATQVAPEVCAHCHRSVWADDDCGVYLAADDSFECDKAPRVTAAWDVRMTQPGVHTPA